MKTRSLLFTGLLALATHSMAQTPMIYCWLNPSIEGPTLPHVVPANWLSCYGTPDTQPGNWGISQPPSHGSSYVSFLREGNGSTYKEGMSQLLNGFLNPGTYVFTVDLAHTTAYATADPMGCYSSLAVYGGNSPCHEGELLWESDAFTHTNWETYSVVIKPTSPWNYITFYPQYLYNCGNGYINVMVDNLTCIEPIEIVNPACDGSTAGSITITPPSALSGPPFTYSWSTGVITPSNTITILTAGTYTVVISDSSGKTITYTFEVECD